MLKGPSALLYGQISPGGLVNQVSREPSSVAANEARLEVGTDGRVQSGLYSTGPLTEDGTVQYGIGLVGRSAGSRYDDVEEQRIGVAPRSSGSRTLIHPSSFRDPTSEIPKADTSTPSIRASSRPPISRVISIRI